MTAGRPRKTNKLTLESFSPEAVALMSQPTRALLFYNRFLIEDWATLAHIAETEPAPLEPETRHLIAVGARVALHENIPRDLNHKRRRSLVHTAYRCGCAVEALLAYEGDVEKTARFGSLSGPAIYGDRTALYNRMSLVCGDLPIPSRCSIELAMPDYFGSSPAVPGKRKRVVYDPQPGA